MATLDELLNEIPTDQIAAKLGVDNETADKAIKSVVPLLVGGLQANADDPDKAADLQANVNSAPSTLLDGGVNVDDVDQQAGNAVVASLFGDNNADDVAAKLAGAGAGNSDLIKQLLPILTPIVLAFVAKKLTGGGAAAAPAEAPAPAVAASATSSATSWAVRSVAGQPRRKQPARQHPGQRTRQQGRQRRPRQHPRRPARRQEVVTQSQSERPGAPGPGSFCHTASRPPGWTAPPPCGQPRRSPKTPVKIRLDRQP